MKYNLSLILTIFLTIKSYSQSVVNYFDTSSGYSVFLGGKNLFVTKSDVKVKSILAYSSDHVKPDTLSKTNEINPFFKNNRILNKFISGDSLRLCFLLDNDTTVFQSFKIEKLQGLGVQIGSSLYFSGDTIPRNLICDSTEVNSFYGHPSYNYFSLESVTMEQITNNDTIIRTLETTNLKSYILGFCNNKSDMLLVFKGVKISSESGFGIGRPSIFWLK